MHPLLLRESVRLLRPLLIVLSIVSLWRGHHLPGGGFIGGLLAGTALLLPALATTVSDPRATRTGASFLASGLSVALVSGLPGLLSGGTLLEGAWLPAFAVPLLGDIHLGTPLLFDVGVYLVVIGFVLVVAGGLDSHD